MCACLYDTRSFCNKTWHILIPPPIPAADSDVSLVLTHKSGCEYFALTIKSGVGYSMHIFVLYTAHT